MKFSEVKVICEEKGYTSRKDRYKIMEEYFGVSGATIKDIMSFDRYLRDILEVDKVGLAKEKEYHTPDYMRSWQNELNSLSIRNN